MRRIILVFLIIIQILSVYGQGRDNLWLMGYDSGAGFPYGNIDIDFFGGIPNIYLHNRPMNFFETNSEITNSQGDLLFYTNGIYIANANNDTMINGSGINPSAYTTQNQNLGLFIGQGDITIPFPSDTSKYYLFHETAYYQSSTGTRQPYELYYSIIDMIQDSGKGAVISKNNILISDTLIFGELTAVKHANGRDWWLIFHKSFSQLFYKSLITPTDISPPDTQTIANMYYAGGGGQCAFSPDGNWYARYQSYDDLTIMQFDRCTGMFYNPIFLAINDTAYSTGLAFSPDSKKVYASSFNYVYQFLLDSANMAATKTTVAIYDSFVNPLPTYFYLAALGNDGKIYINCPNSVMSLHLIDQPNQVGLSCNLIQHGIILPSYNSYTIPNFPNYFLGPVLGSVCDSLGLGIHDNIYTKNLNLRINPNPTQNSFYLNYQLLNGENADMYLYNTLGTEVMRKKLYWYFGYLQIDASLLNDGVYFIKVVTDDRHSGSGKVVIVR